MGEPVFIFLDDERKPEDVTWLKLPKPKTWDVVRSYAGFVKFVSGLKEPPAFISFDHDLGLPKDGSEEKTGVNCALALIEICCERKWKLPGFQVHSKNTIGRQNIIHKMEWGEKWVKIATSPGIKPCNDSDQRKK